MGCRKTSGKRCTPGLPRGAHAGCARHDLVHTCTAYHKSTLYRVDRSPGKSRGHTYVHSYDTCSFARRSVHSSLTSGVWVCRPIYSTALLPSHNGTRPFLAGGGGSPVPLRYGGIFKGGGVGFRPTSSPLSPHCKYFMLPIACSALCVALSYAYVLTYITPWASRCPKTVPRYGTGPIGVQCR